MTRGQRGGRGAAAGFALAAAGMIYQRLGGRRDDPQLDAQSQERNPYAGAASAEELARARSELADELARRASRSDR